MKTLLLIMFLSSINLFAQDSIVYYMGDSVIGKTTYVGNTIFYSNNDVYVKKYDNIIELYRADTLYYLYVYEDKMRFNYILEDGQWNLTFEVIEYNDSIQPYFKGRCEALTKSLTRCKRKGDPFCWQHKN